MLTVNDHLKTELYSCADYNLTSADELFLKIHGVENFIIKKLSSKKFRKWSISENEKQRLQTAVQINLKQNKPILFVFPFGGYKLWRLPTAPQSDWAEFFTIAYYCRYIAPILKVYPPGAILYFSSDDVLIRKMDNIPSQDTEAYLQSFLTLLSCFQAHLPANLKLELKRISDLYGQEDFDTEINDIINKITPLSQTWDENKKRKLFKTSSLNFKINGAVDYSQLSEEEQKKQIERGYVIHEAYRDMSQKIAFVYQANKIVLAAKPTIQGIPIGTTKNSITKFWTGTGVLEPGRHGQPYAHRILSHRQWLDAQHQPRENQKIDLIPLSNFQEISVYADEFNFPM